MTTLEALLLDGRGRLKRVGIPTAGLDARVLAGHLLGLEAAAVIARGQDVVEPALQDAFLALIDRRAAGEPVARIVGMREFHGHTLRLGPETLIPRPDTETLVDQAVDLVREGRIPGVLSDGTGLVFADAGTGSGAIAIAVAAALPGARGIATDLSAAAIAVAAANAQALGLHERIVFRVGSYLEPIDEPLAMVLSNPPYIATAELETLSIEVRRHDPVLALDGGAEGLDAYRALLPQAAARLADGGTLGVEIGWTQGPEVVALALENGFQAPYIGKDLAGRDRVVLARKG